jgi:hypothetical protein
MARARIAAAWLVALGVLVSPRVSSAQESVPERLDFSSVNLLPARLTTAVQLAPVPARALILSVPASLSSAPVVREMPSIPPIVPERRMFGNKALMSSLYATTAIVQGLDLHSSLRAFRAGAVEGNPLMGPVTKNRAAFVATKAAVTAATILATRKIAKKNRVAAVITIVAVNSAYAMIVGHNYRLSRR